MKSVAERIMEYAEASPEASPICPGIFGGCSG